MTPRPRPKARTPTIATIRYRTGGCWAARAISQAAVADRPTAAPAAPTPAAVARARVAAVRPVIRTPLIVALPRPMTLTSTSRKRNPGRTASAGPETRTPETSGTLASAGPGTLTRAAETPGTLTRALGTLA